MGRGCAPLTPGGSQRSLHTQQSYTSRPRTGWGGCGRGGGGCSNPSALPAAPEYGTGGRVSRPGQTDTAGPERGRGRAAAAAGQPGRGARGRRGRCGAASREGLRAPRGATRPRAPGPAPAPRRGAAGGSEGRSVAGRAAGAARGAEGRRPPGRGDAARLGTHPSRPWCRRARSAVPASAPRNFPDPPPRAPAARARPRRAPRPTPAAPWRPQRDPPARPRAGTRGSPAPLGCGPGARPPGWKSAPGQQRPRAWCGPPPKPVLPRPAQPDRAPAGSPVRTEAASAQPASTAQGLSSLEEQDPGQGHIPPRTALQPCQARLGSCSPALCLSMP